MEPPRLTIELVPSANWYVNARSVLTQAEWNRVRRAVYRRARYRCEICGGRGGSGVNHPVECHEVWDYDDAKHVQRLVRLMALCPPCHRVKHFGLATIEGHKEEALRHLAQVNGWTLEAAERYADRTFEIWEARNRHEWHLDVSLLESKAFRRWIARKRSDESSSC